MKIAICTITLAAAIVALTAAASPHSGGTDANGCHHNRKTGGYHCHRSPAQKAYEARQAAMAAERELQRTRLLLQQIQQPSRQPGMFHGYACTDDCSGHEAGYEWAEENSITDPDECGGNSQSFIEGCEAWAEANE